MRIGAKIKYINHNFYEAMKSGGFTTMLPLSEVTGISQSLLGRYLNLKDFPKTERTIKKLETALKRPFEYLFPEEIIKLICDECPTQRYIVKDVSYVEYSKTSQMELSYVDDSLNRMDFLAELKKSMTALSQRERLIIEHRFGLKDGKSKDLEAVGKIFNVTRERVRQVEGKALRKLRKPEISRQLKEFIYR